MIGQSICSVMKCNDTIEVLNIESNFISSTTMTDLVHEACKSPVLRELRIDNQRNRYASATKIFSYSGFLITVAIFSKKVVAFWLRRFYFDFGAPIFTSALLFWLRRSYFYFGAPYNIYFSFGEKTENLFCESIAEGSGILQKLSYSWRAPGPRQRSQVLLLQNRDKLTRLKRNDNGYP